MTKYLLDTNVLCEPRKPKPAQQVVRWMDSVPQYHHFISALTVGEIRKGLERMPSGKKRVDLSRWLEIEIPRWFETRILPVDEDVADAWGILMANAHRTPAAIDTLLAATAIANNLTLVTRNARDFDFPGLKLLNPWAEE